jgi:hypothetical protein
MEERSIVLTQEEARAAWKLKLKFIRRRGIGPRRDEKNKREWWITLPGRGMSWTSNLREIEVRDIKTKALKRKKRYYMPLRKWIKGECPYGRIGQVLWVKEQHALISDAENGDHVMYTWTQEPPPGVKRRAANAMQREHSRMSIGITDISFDMFSSEWVIKVAVLP